MPGSRHHLVVFLLAIALGGGSSWPADVAADGFPESVRALLRADDWVAALAALEQRKVDPADVETRSLLGQALFRAGRLEEVEAAIGMLAGQADAPARALMTLGRLRDAEGRAGEGVELMRRAVEAAPDDPLVLFRAADVAASREEAIERLERYLTLSDDEPEDRIEAARGSLALFRALGRRAIWSPQSRPERIELPLRPLWIPQGGDVVGYVVRVRLGGSKKAVPLLLDSGSPGLYVIDRVAAKRQFAPLARITVFGGGGSGRHSTRRGFFPAIEIDTLRFADVLATVSRSEIDPLGRFHGLLGLSAFHGYHVTIDLARRRLTLDRTVEPIEAGSGAPYYTIGGQMLVRATTTADGSGLFLFDTGATRTLVAHALIEQTSTARRGAVIELPAFGGLRRGVEELDGLEVRLLGESTGNTGLRAVDLSLRSEVGGVEIAGFVGLDLLDGRTIEVDTRSRRVLLHPRPQARRRR